AGDLGDAHRRVLVERLLRDGIPARDRQLVRRPRASVWFASFGLVPVAVVKGNEDDALADTGQPRRRLDPAARRLDRDEIAVSDAQSFAILGCEFDPRLGCGVLQLGRPAGFRTRVPVVDGPPGV